MFMRKSELTMQAMTKLGKLLDRHVDIVPGAEDFTTHRAYLWDGQKKSLKPIKRPAHIDHDDPIGIDAVKKEVTRNTKNFINSIRANNVLLWAGGRNGRVAEQFVRAVLDEVVG
jgi:predicted AAA+ superfamily ATPase